VSCSAQLGGHAAVEMRGGVDAAAVVAVVVVNEIDLIETHIP